MSFVQVNGNWFTYISLRKILLPIHQELDPAVHWQTTRNLLVKKKIPNAVQSSCALG